MLQGTHLAEEETGWTEAAGGLLLPTFLRVIQLEDIWVLRVIRQLHHPAHNGDLLSRCGFILEERNE
jgi:hypothetical protein